MVTITSCNKQKERAGVSMEWILYIISLLWIGAGSCLILYTQQSRVFLKKALRGVGLKLLSIIPITIGALLIAAAYYSTAFWTIVVLGILAIGKGCFFIFNPGKAADKIMRWFLDAVSDNMYRLAGIIALILGTALLSWI
jgi:uncharacterized protein YjeT (DUF2065 family)